MTGSLCWPVMNLVAATSPSCERLGSWTILDAVDVLQEVVYALPAGAVHEPAVYEDDGGLGSIVGVCAHGLLLSDPLFLQWRVNLFHWMDGATIRTLARTSENSPSPTLGE
jgi:hypothetical protein